MLVGTWSSASLIGRSYVSLDLVGWSVLCFAAAFVSAQIARRALPSLDIAQTTIAAPIAIMVLIGLRDEYVSESVEPSALIPLGGVVLGSLAGALTSRGRAETAARWTRVFGAGFATFGASSSGALVSLVLGGSDLLGAVIGGCAGSFLVAMWTTAEGRHCAAGFGLVLAGTLVGSSLSEDAGTLIAAMLGAMFAGVVIGAIGGRLGECLRREPTIDVPEAKAR